MTLLESPAFWHGMVYLTGGLILITGALWVADWAGNKRWPV